MRQTHLGELASGPKLTQYGKNALFKNIFNWFFTFFFLQNKSCASEFVCSDLATFLTFTVTFETKEQCFSGFVGLNLISQSLKGQTNLISSFTQVVSSHANLFA